MMTEKDSWEYRLPHESVKAFKYFNTYLDLGIHRSLVKVRETHNNDISLSQLKVYSKKYKWVKRAEEYEEHLIKLKNQKLREEQEAYFKNRRKILKQYDKVNDRVMEELMIDLGLLKDPQTGEIKKNKRITSTSVANSLKNLSDANINNAKLSLRLMGLPETIKDNTQVKLEGNLDTENTNNNININYEVDKTSDDYFNKQLEFIDKMISEHNERRNK